MTLHEKALNAINARLERLQAGLRDAREEPAQRFLLQAIVATVAAAEALNDYVKAVGQHAQRRHAEAKSAHDALGAQHAGLLQSGQELLAQLKANPTDRALRKEIDRVQQSMAAVQKSVRRAANALQRDLAPSLALVDRAAESVRRLGDADDTDDLRRVIKTTLAMVRELGANQPGLPAKANDDVPAWEKLALAEIDDAAGFPDASARASFHATLALERMALAVSDQPPRSTEEASERARAAVAARLKQITARITAP